MAKTGPDTPDDDRPDDDRVLHIYFRAGDSERIEETLDALDSGETPDAYVERVYHDPDELHRITRPKNLELLRTVVRERPASIRETARLVERDVRQVHRNLEELEALGLLDFEETDRAKRPRVWYDEINVELPLGEDRAEDSETAEV
ncbi:HVO_A0114 family putative DNA-binding protein [Halorussus ruber]|uniref:HVO_A0114 family putative DNA-binding protein n=1 Tax=Halorussus ruber TaxID=1126238 RepID=UPI0010925EA0|nr:transcriptional regulator [Halorussus ruber]